jgi:protein gp37
LDLAARWKWAEWGPGKPRRVTADSTWAQVRTWARKARATFGRRARVFCASLADVFDEEAPIPARRLLWTLAAETCLDLEWMFVTKRPEMIPVVMHQDVLHHEFFEEIGAGLMTSIGVQSRAWCADQIKVTPALWHGLSCEPLLEELRFSPAQLRGLSWVIVGGESGDRARPFNFDWARNLFHQCENVGQIALFMKQTGELVFDGGRFVNVNGKGEDFDSFPPELQRREWPEFPVVPRVMARRP